MARIYLASSWRNKDQPHVLAELRNAGHEVYDFRNPDHGRGGFAWADIDPNWQDWTAKQYVAALGTQIAAAGFHADRNAMMWANVGLLLLPAGRSAHLEIGFMAGCNKVTMILTRDGQEPELMAKLCTRVVTTLADALITLQRYGPLSERFGK